MSFGSPALDAFVRELVDAAGASLFDPAPLKFQRANVAGVVPVREKLALATGVRHRLERMLPRSSFLYGCLKATETEENESAIIGFGKRCGSTTRISEIRHELGDEACVQVADAGALTSEIVNFLNSDLEAEVVLFHNHPTNVVREFLGNAPMASSRDRRTLLAWRYSPSMFWRVLLGAGNTRFFLGENGFVREFRTPSLRELWGLLDRQKSRGS